MVYNHKHSKATIHLLILVHLSELLTNIFKTKPRLLSSNNIFIYLFYLLLPWWQLLEGRFSPCFVHEDEHRFYLFCNRNRCFVFFVIKRTHSFTETLKSSLKILAEQSAVPFLLRTPLGCLHIASIIYFLSFVLDKSCNQCHAYFSTLIYKPDHYYT